MTDIEEARIILMLAIKRVRRGRMSSWNILDALLSLKYPGTDKPLLAILSKDRTCDKLVSDNLRQEVPDG